MTSGQVLAVLEEGAAAARRAGREGRRRKPRRRAAQPPRSRAAPRPHGSGKLAPVRAPLVEEKQLDPVEDSGARAAMAASPRAMSSTISTSRPPGSGAEQAARRAAKPRRRRRRRRRPPGAARADDAPARAHRRAPARSAAHAGAMLTTFNEVDLKAVMACARSTRTRFEKKHGIKLGFMSFFVKAAVEALQALPGRQRVGRRQRHRLSRVLRHRRRGLDREGPDRAGAAQRRTCRASPTSRRTSASSPSGARRQDHDRRAHGGTFTITNGGTFGSLMSTPIVNPPQSAILGMHKIKERPMVVNGADRDPRR